MAQGLWVRTIRNHRMDKQTVEPCTRKDPQDALVAACLHLDLPKPMWLEKNQRDWDQFGQTRFMPDAFIESVEFDRMEIEFIDPDAPRKRSADFRNSF